MRDPSVQERMLNGTYVFILRHDLLMEGRATDEGGVPLRQACVSATHIEPDGDFASSGSATVNNGKFTIHMVGGRNILYVHASGFADRAILVDVSENRPLPVIALERGRNVQIRVTDDLGQPVPWARIRTHDSLTEGGRLLSLPPLTDLPQVVQIAWRNHTDHDGLVTATNIPWHPIDLEVHCKGYQTNVLNLSSNVLSASIVLRKAARQ